MAKSTTYKGAAKPFGKSGHFDESMRHSLQAKGIKTGNLSGINPAPYSVEYFPNDSDKLKVIKGFETKEQAKRYIKAENLEDRGDDVEIYLDLGAGRYQYQFPDKGTVTVYAASLQEAKKKIAEQVKIPKSYLPVFDGTLTEQNLRLVLRRLNDGKMKPQDLPFPDDGEGIKLTDEQVAKGKEWLMKLWKTENGTERKNSPYGYREQAALETLETIKLIDFYDDSKYGQQPHYVPLYRVEGKDTMFEYYGFGDTISIIG